MRRKKKFSVLVSQNTLPKRIPLPPSPIETSTFEKISISLSPEKDKDSTISDEAKKETVKLEISDENITGTEKSEIQETNDVTDGQASGPMASLVQKISNASEIKDALEVYECQDEFVEAIQNSNEHF